MVFVHLLVAVDTDLIGGQIPANPMVSLVPGQLLVLVVLVLAAQSYLCLRNTAGMRTYSAIVAELASG